MNLPRIPPKLIEKVRQKNCVLFVGAGLSQAAGLPGWKVLLIQILSWCEDNSASIQNLADIRKLIEQGELLRAAQSIKEAVPAEMFRHALSEIVDRVDIAPTPTHELLPKIPFAAVLTSNYDKLLETAYARAAIMPRILTHNNTSALSASLHEGRFYILKAHGTIDQIETIILGGRSYRDLIHSNEAYREHLRTVFRTKTVLFVGFSLSDPDLLSLLDKEQVIFKGCTNLHYSLMNAGGINSLIRQEWNQEYGIQILPYEPSNEYHPEVEEFFKELARQVVTPAVGAGQQASQPEANSSQEVIDSAPLPEPTTSNKVSESQRQIDKALNALKELVGGVDFVSQAGPPQGEDDFHPLRLRLLLATRIKSQIPDSMPGTHEANRLYHHRERLKATGPEYVELLRMLIGDSQGYVPGWYWFREFGAEDAEVLIFHLALNDSYALIRQRAFSLLADIKAPVQAGGNWRLSSVITSDRLPEVRKAALSYLGIVGEEGHLPMIGSALVDPDASVRSEAKRSKFLVLARTDPERALTELLTESGVETRSLLNALLPGAANVSLETLLRALDSTDEDIRLFVVKELKRRGELTTKLAVSLKQDKYTPVRAEAYHFLIEKGEAVEPSEVSLDLPDDFLGRRLNRSIIFKPSPLVDKEGILPTLFKRYDFEQLIGLAGWDTLRGVDAYCALAFDHFAEFADRLRSDLRDEFAATAEGYYQQLLAELTRDSEKETATSPYDFTPSFSGIFSGGLFATQRSSQQRQQFTPESSARWQVDYQKTEYITAALAGLARHGEQPDVEFGRRYLYHDEYDLRLEAVRIVSRFGTEADTPDLVRIAKSADGELKEIAARAALRVSNFNGDVVKDLLATGDEAITSVVVIELTGHEDKARMAALLEPYLYAENQIVRTSVMAFFSASLKREELEQLLDRYLSAATYYYDVVCCFDRSLYSPPNLLAAFGRKMLQDLQRRTWTCGDLNSHRM